MTLDVSSAMDLTPNTPKSPPPPQQQQQQQQQHDPEAQTRIQQPVTVKPLSFSNGVLKRHPKNPPPPPPPPPISYKECLKNHAASLGGHALDGCGEFMPSPTSSPSDPSSIKCAACGCHRNFHRREPDDPPASHVIEYQPLHRHHPPQPLNRSPSSASPPPISSSYFPSAPHMLLALSAHPESTAAPTNAFGPGPIHPGPTNGNSSNSRKRFRTKFTQEQKERMYEFAERVGWKMQRRDDDLVHEFCVDVGVDRSVLKVWMHNNKNTLGKKFDVVNGNNIPINNNNDDNNNSSHDHDHVHVHVHDDHHHGIAANGGGIGGGGAPHGEDHHYGNMDGGANVATNGSSSSS